MPGLPNSRPANTTRRQGDNMRLILSIAVAATITATAHAQTPAADAPAPFNPFKDESLLGPIPDGFKLGYRTQQQSVVLMEFVPMTETVENWSTIVTQVIVGDKAQRASITASVSSVVSGYARACGVQDAVKLSEGRTNGYPYELWRVTCPMNPQTSMPEFVHMKVIRGADALYNVQYAMRAMPAPEGNAIALAYLESALVCDPRTGQNPCPEKQYAPTTMPGESASTSPH